MQFYVFLAIIWRQMNSPDAEMHEWDGGTGEGDGQNEERLSAPHVRQGPYQWRTQERKHALQTQTKLVNALNVAEFQHKRRWLPRRRRRRRREDSILYKRRRRRR
jgi:hypothetical protein